MKKGEDSLQVFNVRALTQKNRHNSLKSSVHLRYNYWENHALDSSKNKWFLYFYILMKDFLLLVPISKEREM